MAKAKLIPCYMCGIANRGYGRGDPLGHAHEQRPLFGDPGLCRLCAANLRTKRDDFMYDYERGVTQWTLKW